MAIRDEISESIRGNVAEASVRSVGGPVVGDEFGDLGRLQDIRERRKHHRTIVNAWRQQQDQDRRMRKLYATWLMIAMSVQVVAIHVLFVLIGLGRLKFEPGTANTFVTAVFAEVAALVLVVVKYPFPTSSSKALDLIDRFRADEPPR